MFIAHKTDLACLLLVQASNNSNNGSILVAPFLVVKVRQGIVERQHLFSLFSDVLERQRFCKREWWQFAGLGAPVLWMGFLGHDKSEN